MQWRDEGQRWNPTNLKLKDDQSSVQEARPIAEKVAG